MLRIIIADDEKGIRLFLKNTLSDISGVRVILEASTGEEVLAFVMDNEADLILFDIDMPQIDGMTAAKEIFKINPEIKIIFITAYPDHALEAFKVYPVDYILKPINAERLKQSIELIKQNTGSVEQTHNEINKVIEGIISVKEKEETVFLFTDEIIMIERQNRKTLVHLQDRVLIINESLQELEKRLPYYFLRSHKSFIINIKKIAHISRWYKLTYQIGFRGTDKTAILSKKQKELLKSLIN